MHLYKPQNGGKESLRIRDGGILIYHHRIWMSNSNRDA